MRKIGFTLLFLFGSCAIAQTDNTYYAKQFKGPDVRTKVTAALASCNTAIQCYVIIDPSLASFATGGALPSGCGNCHIIDYRADPFSLGSLTGTVTTAPSNTQTITQPINTSLYFLTSGTGAVFWNGSQLCTAANALCGTGTIASGLQSEVAVYQGTGQHLAGSTNFEVDSLGDVQAKNLLLNALSAPGGQKQLITVDSTGTLGAAPSTGAQAITMPVGVGLNILTSGGGKDLYNGSELCTAANGVCPSSGSGSPVIPAGANVLFIGDSRLTIAGDCLGGGDGNTFTGSVSSGVLTLASTNFAVAGDVIEISGIGAGSYSGLNGMSFSVSATGLSSSSLQLAGTNYNESQLLSHLPDGSTGPGFFSCSDTIPGQTMRQPYFAGANAINLASGDNTVANAISTFATAIYPVTASQTGKPTYAVIQLGEMDALDCTPAATIESNLQNLWSLLKAQGVKIIQTTLIAYKPGPRVGCAGGENLTAAVNDWLAGQGPSSWPYTTSITPPHTQFGVDWDFLADWGGTLSDGADANYFLGPLSPEPWHPTVNGASIAAIMLNGEMIAPGSGTRGTANQVVSGKGFVNFTTYEDTVGGAYGWSLDSECYGSYDCAIWQFQNKQYAQINIAGTGLLDPLGWNAGGYVAETFDRNHAGRCWTQSSNLDTKPDLCFLADQSINGQVDVSYSPTDDTAPVNDTSGGLGLGFLIGAAAAPTGSCTSGRWTFTQDGKASFCKAGTWEVAVTAP